MPQARKCQVSLVDTPYYHCVSRCVRRAFLCGEDKYTGRSYEHRRQWVEDRLLYLGTVFSLDICAYAVMSNHTHVVLHIDKAQAKGWSEEEVLRRWHSLHQGTFLTRRYADPQQRLHLSQGERFTAQQTIEVYRKRLYDLSWFMRELNEHIAREANKEDECTGRFWEGRFKSQALLDESALAACMAYVDLNPIRASMADTPETSIHTSIYRRLNDACRGYQPSTLMAFVGNPRQNQPKGLAFKLIDYIELVEQSGRAVQPQKRGHIDARQSPVLQRLGLNASQWLSICQNFEQHFRCAAGAEAMMEQFKQQTGRRRMKGMAQARLLLASR